MLSCGATHTFLTFSGTSATITKESLGFLRLLNIREYSEILRNIWEYLEILGNTRKYSEILGNTRDQIGISPRFVGLVMISAFLWLFGRRLSPRRVVDCQVVC